MDITPEAILFLAVSLFMVATIPRERLQRVFPEGFVYGLVAPLLGAFVVRYLFGVHLSPTRFTIASLDLWLLLAWIPQFALFYNFLPRRDTWQFWAYITAFAVLSTTLWRTFAHAGRLAGLNALLTLAGTFVVYAAAPYFQLLFADRRADASSGPPPDPRLPGSAPEPPGSDPRLSGSDSQPPGE
ncbi:MAG: hypothetical protein ACM3RP_06840 [Chitinophagales bacterium]